MMNKSNFKGILIVKETYFWMSCLADLYAPYFHLKLRDINLTHSFPLIRKYIIHLSKNYIF